MPDALPYWRLSSFYFFYFAVLGAMVPYWSLYLNNIGFNARDIGLLMAVIQATRIVAPNIWGWLADRSGQRLRVIRWGSFLAFVSFLLIFKNQSFVGLALATSLYTFFWNAVMAQFEVITLSHLAGQT